jgi:hypothetical protein
MPAHINYETTPIVFYKFICENPEIQSCYVGHTTNFQQRKNSHKSRCNKITSVHYNYKIYQTIRENGGWDNWKMIEIDRQICVDKSDSCRIEQRYIDELQSNMNMINSIFNREQWYTDNKNRICQKNKYNYIDNKTDILNKNKQHRLNNLQRFCEMGKKYRETHVEQIQNYRSKIIMCDCNNTFTQGNKQQHLKSKKHLAYLKSIENIPL